MLLHKPAPFVIQITKGSGVALGVIQGAKFFECSDCLEVSSPVKTAAAKPPSLFAFNHDVIIDVFYIHDMARICYGFLSIVDNGTTYHSISLVCEGQGIPRSSKRFAKLQANWCAWAG